MMRAVMFGITLMGAIPVTFKIWKRLDTLDAALATTLFVFAFLSWYSDIVGPHA
jgi:hypothetical protein